MSSSASSIYYLPGLGADERLFSLLHKELPGKSVVWPTHQGCEDIYAFAKECLRNWNLPQDACLVGFSFGGMVAKTIFQIGHNENLFSKDARLVMISSCRTKHALDPLFVKRASMLKYIPNFLLRFGLVHIGPQFVAGQDKEAQQHLPLLQQMAKETDLGFFRWATQVCAEWQLEESQIEGVKCLQIHGENDKVIPYPTEDPDLILKGAGHLITLTRTRKVTDTIKNFI